MLKKIKNLISNKTRKDLRFAFKSVGGHNYYYIVDLLQGGKAEIEKLPFARYYQYSSLIWEYHNSLRNEELEMWIEQAQKITDIKVMGVALEALKFRREMAMALDTIYEIMAVVYIRADDDMKSLNSEQLAERARDIKLTAESGDFFFLHYPSLYFLLDFNHSSELSWTILVRNLERQKEVFQEAIKALVAKSTPSKNTKNL
jgi:Tat protein secretion system quality control protein TatD with DNase activity